MNSSEIEMKRLLEGAFSGSDEDRERLIETVYDVLHQMARRAMAHEGPCVTLQPTALLNEAYVRLFHENMSPPCDRQHFLALAARVIRNILVDHARRKKAERHGGQLVRVSFAEAERDADPDIDLLVVHDLLTRLERISPNWHRMLEYRYFAGMKVAEIAALMGMGKSTVDKQLAAARAWLRKQAVRADP